MSRSFGFIALLVVAAAALGIYARQAGSLSGGGSPSLNVDIVGVKHDLMAMAQAERTHAALHSGYGSLEDLRAAGELTMSRDSRGPYTYTMEVTAAGFKVTATYNGPENPLAPKVLSIDQGMSVIQE